MSTSDGEILAYPAGGSIEAVVRRGEVAVVFGNVPEGTVSLSADQGDVRLELPPDSGFTIEGDVRSGSFVTDFSEVTSARSASPAAGPGDSDVLSVRGVVGQGSAEIHFEVQGGRLSLIDRGRWPWG